MFKYFIAGFIFVSNVICSYAYENPIGDICPRIEVKNNKFLMYYLNNVRREFNMRKVQLEGKPLTPGVASDDLMLKVFSKEGRPIEGPSKVGWVGLYWTTQFMPIDNINMEISKGLDNDFVLINKNEWTYMFPSIILDSNDNFYLKCKKKDIDTSFLNFIGKNQDILPRTISEYKKEKLNLDIDYPFVINSVIMDGQNLTLSVIKEYKELYLTIFNLSRQKKILNLKLGPLPKNEALGRYVSSKVLKFDSKYLIVWMKKNTKLKAKKNDIKKSTIYLSLLNPQNKNIRNITIVKEAFINTSISANIIDNILMVAYYQGTISDKPTSKIITKFINLDGED